jgi:hypothetical protein
MSDSDSDEWATAELPDAAVPQQGPTKKTEIEVVDDDDDKDWSTPLLPCDHKATRKSRSHSKQDDNTDGGEPMILVDLTELTCGAIHSRFDAFSVNDPAAVAAWRHDNKYVSLAKDTSLIAKGTVIPCGSSVWRTALSTLKRERPGHFITPVFPPK